jgi:hypothetical protein
MAITSHSVPVKWGAGVGFFMLMHSLAYFYYYIPGSDIFNLNLVSAYFSGGFMNTQVSAIYPWPVFFFLIHMLGEVTTFPLNVAVSVYYFVTGFVIVSAVFFIATKHGFDGFWSVVALSIVGFFYLNYQFAPETLAFAFVTILLCIDYAWGKGRAGNVTELSLVLTVAFSHSFELIYYAAYRFARAFRNRVSLTHAIFIIVVGLAVNMFLIASYFSIVTLLAFNSIEMMFGLSDYGRMAALTLTTGASPFQGFSRLSVLSAVIVSGLGVAGIIRSRRALPQDAPLVLASTLMLGVGAVVTVVGARAIQLAIVVAAIGGGYFPTLLHTRKVSVLLLLFLSISSIFPVMHANYQPLLYQPQEDAQAARFLSSKIELDGRGWSNRLRIFTPYIVRGFFGLSDNGNASINVFFSFDETNVTSKVDYVLAPTATPAFAGSTYLVAKSHLLSTDNLIFNYGDGVIYAAI